MNSIDRAAQVTCCSTDKKNQFAIIHVQFFTHKAYVMKPIQDNTQLKQSFTMNASDCLIISSVADTNCPETKQTDSIKSSLTKSL